MTLTHTHQLMLVALFWAIFIPIGAFLVRQTCSLFRIGMPSYPRAALMLLLVGPLAYLTFDFSAYIIMRSMAGELIPVPPGYTYSYWLWHEPLLLKWRILSLLPLMRFLPIVFALCVAGVLQVLLLNLEVNFRVGVLLSLVQAVVNILAIVLLGFVFNLVVATILKIEAHEHPQLTHPTPHSPSQRR